MNREKKEQLKANKPLEVEKAHTRKLHEAWYDGTNFPELFLDFYDSSSEQKSRERGISTLKKEVRELIRYRLENGIYPERLHYLAYNELKLKHESE